LVWGRKNELASPVTSAGYVAYWLQAIGDPDEASKQAELLRDIAGNPFRVMPQKPTIETSPNWMLEQMRWAYEQRAFLALPIWADALEDAGYSDAMLLSHLRSCEAHARGCWAVDLFLGRGEDRRTRHARSQAHE
jgi:hypothetical protein